MRCLGININSLKSFKHDFFWQKNIVQRLETQKSKKKFVEWAQTSRRAAKNQRNSRILGISSLAHVDVINCLSSFVMQKNLRSSSINSRFSILACKLFNKWNLLSPPVANPNQNLNCCEIYFPKLPSPKRRLETKWQYYCSCLIIPHIFTAFFARVRASRENVEGKLGKTSSRVEMWINRKSAMLTRRKKTGERCKWKRLKQINSQPGRCSSVSFNWMRTKRPEKPIVELANIFRKWGKIVSVTSKRI